MMMLRVAQQGARNGLAAQCRTRALVARGSLRTPPKSPLGRPLTLNVPSGARSSAVFSAADLAANAGMALGAACEAQAAQVVRRVYQVAQNVAPRVRRASGTIVTWAKLGLMPSAIACSADLVVQGVQAGDLKTGYQQWDMQRTFAFGCFGFFYSGMFQRVIYSKYDALLGTGTCLMTVTKKVLVDTTCHAPLMYLPIFYLSTGLLQSMSLEDSFERLTTSFQPAMQTYCCLWVPAMYGVFAFVPVTHRIFVVACFAWVEKAIYSWLDAGKQPLEDAVSSS